MTRLHTPGLDLTWPAFFVRVVGGLLFAMAGYQKVFVMTPGVHAKMLFVAPYADSWIPEPVLWGLGYVVPYVELVAGTLLAIGWQRRAAAFVLATLLVVVTYGHTLEEAFFDVSTHILPRLVLVLPTLALHPANDPWSIDGVLAVRAYRRAQRAQSGQQVE